jgi:hypothetical protein
VAGFVLSDFLDWGFISEANSELVRLLALCIPDLVLIFRFVIGFTTTRLMLLI